MGVWSNTNGWRQTSYPNGVNVVAGAATVNNGTGTVTQDVDVTVGTLRLSNSGNIWTIATNGSGNALTFAVSGTATATIFTIANANLTVQPDIILNSPLSVATTNTLSSGPGCGIYLNGTITGPYGVTLIADEEYAGSTPTPAYVKIGTMNNSGPVVVISNTNGLGASTVNGLGQVTISNITANVTSLTKSGTYGTLWMNGGTVAGPITGDANQLISKTTAGGTLLAITNSNNSTTYNGTWVVGANQNVSYGPLLFGSANAMGASNGNVTIKPSGVLAAGYPIDQAFLTHINTNNTTQFGVIALATNSANNLDLSGSISNVFQNGVTLGSVGTNIYAGTLTVNSAQGYRLGGGGGMLLITNQNLLTGSLPVQVGNNYVSPADQGGVIVSNTQNYTGLTRIYGITVYGTSGILSTPYLANGGQPSGIGASGFAATNLCFQGGTLRYTGTGAQIDRLFELDYLYTHTLDASGTGSIQFTNAGAITLGINTKGNRVFMLAGSSTNDNTLTPGYADGTGNNLGTNALVKSGSGKWVLSGADTYTGPTTVTNGTLWVNGSISSTNPSVGGTFVFPGATLGGTGKVASAVTVTGGTVAPGAPMGTLTVGSVSMNSNATLAVQLNGANQYSQLKSAGNVALSNCMLGVTVLGPVGARDRYTIVNSTNGVVSGQFASGGLVTANNGAKFTIMYGTTNVILSSPPGGTAVLFR